jgi:hypothetical protein
MVDNLELNAITPTNAISLLIAHMFIDLVNIKLPNHHVRLKNLTHPPPTMFPQPFPGDTSKKKSKIRELNKRCNIIGCWVKSIG